MQLKRVVITGLGAITPVGNSAPDTWKALVAGTNGIAPITSFDASLFKTQFAGEVKGFDPTTIIDRKEVRRLDRYAQFSLCVADEALKDSALDSGQFEQLSRLSLAERPVLVADHQHGGGHGMLGIFLQLLP